MFRVCVFLLAVLGFPAIPRTSAQSVISVRSGLINYFEGDVVVNGERLERKYGSFARLRPGSDLVTRSGRAEMLLTPNTYMRLGEDSSIRMQSDSLSDTRIELLNGSAIVDSTKAPDAAATHVTLIFRNSEIRLLDPGTYRMDVQPPQFRVFRGTAEVSEEGKTTRVGPSQLYALDGSSVVQRFTEGSDGLLDLWSQERQLLISSNLTNSQAITDPLLDPDPPSFGALDAYLGYIPPPVARAPLATVPPLYNTYSYSGLYGYGGLYGNPYGYGGLAFGPGYGFSAFAPISPAFPIYGVPSRFGAAALGRPAIPGASIGIPRIGVGQTPVLTPHPGYVPGRPPIGVVTPRPTAPVAPHPVAPHAIPAIPRR